MLDALTFLLFGALLLGPALAALDVRTCTYAVVSLTVVRMVPAALCLLGTGLRPATVAFVGWFGPRGLASIVFVLLLVEVSSLEEKTLVLQVVTTTVVLSVLLHGLTARAGAARYARWFGRHGEPSMAEAVPVTATRVRRRRHPSAPEG